MRRTLALVAGACTAVALVGATAYARTADRETPHTAVAAAAEAPVVPQGVAKAVPAAPAKAAEAAAAPAADRRESVTTPSAIGREKIGAIDAVDELLGYRGEGTSQTFSYPGADYVKVHFDKVALLPGDYVTVADPKGTEVQRIESGLLSGAAAKPRPWAMSVEGDSAVVTLHRARPDLLAGVEELAGLGVGVDKVAHGFTPAEKAENAAAGPGREESVCGRTDSKDAVCYKSTNPVAYNRSKAVARLLINGNELCTAWRLGASDRMLTNNHCMVTSNDAYDTEVWFDYQCAVCGGHGVFKPTKVWGDQVLSTDKTLDYTLFSVEGFNTIQKYGYLEIDPTRPVKGTEVYIPQHPGGDPGVIAMTSDKDARGNCAVADPAYDGYAAGSDVSYYCDTAGGSSGSPVISRTSNKVIALHHFGGCPNSGVRIDLVYSKIKRYL
jgi:lysyl endopeptidase